MLRIPTVLLFAFSLSSCDRLPHPAAEPSLDPKPGLEFRLLEEKPCLACKEVKSPLKRDGTREPSWYAHPALVHSKDILSIRKMEVERPGVAFGVDPRIGDRIFRDTSEHVGGFGGWVVGDQLVGRVARISAPFRDRMMITFETPQERFDFLSLTTVEPNVKSRLPPAGGIQENP